MALSRSGHALFSTGAVILIACAVLAWHLWPIWTGAGFFEEDARFDFPYLHLLVAGFAAEGELPLWNPYLNCGQPLYYIHAWQGIYNPLTGFIAAVSRLQPGFSIVRIYLLVYGALAVALLAAAHRYFQLVGGPGPGAFCASLVWMSTLPDLVSSATSNVFVRLLLPPLLLAVTLWQRSGRSTALFTGGVFAGLGFSLGNYAVREMALAYGAAVGIVLVSSGRRLPRIPWRPLLLTGLLFSLVLLPRLLIAVDVAADPIYRICRPPAPAVAVIPSGSILISHASRLLQLLAYTQLNNPVWPVLSPAVLLLGFGWRGRRSRAARALLLLLSCFLLFGREPFTALLRLFPPRVAVTIGFDPFETVVVVAALALAARGLNRLAAYKRAIPLRGNRVFLLLPAVLLFVQSSTLPASAALLAVPGALAAFLLLSRIASGSPALLVAVAVLPALLALLPRHLYPSPEPFATAAVVFPVPAVRAPFDPATLPDEVYRESADYPLLLHTLSADGTIWRRQRYQELLTSLPAGSRRQLFRLGQPVWEFVPDREGDTGVLTVRAFLPDRCELTIHAGGSGSVRLAQLRHPGWQLFHNGTAAAFAESDIFTLTTRVPAGDSRLTFSFSRPAFRAATLLHWLALLLLCLLALRSRQSASGGTTV